MITVKSKSNFSFRKLLNNFDKIFDGYFSGEYKHLAQDARVAINRGVRPILKKTTKHVRKHGLSPRVPFPTAGVKPLLHTGNLLSSIRAKKDGVEMLEYGSHHLTGFTVGKNKFADRFNFTGKKVPARNPFLTPTGKVRDKKGRQKRLIARINRAWRTKGRF